MTIIVTLIILFVIQYITEKREVEKDYDRFVAETKNKHQFTATLRKLRSFTKLSTWLIKMVVAHWSIQPIKRLSKLEYIVRKKYYS